MKDHFVDLFSKYQYQCVALCLRLILKTPLPSVGLSIIFDLEFRIQPAKSISPNCFLFHGLKIHGSIYSRQADANGRCACQQRETCADWRQKKNRHSNETVFAGSNDFLAGFLKFFYFLRFVVFNPYRQKFVRCFKFYNPNFPKRFIYPGNLLNFIVGVNVMDHLPVVLR